MLKTKIMRTLIAVAAVTTLAAGVSDFAFADTRWQANHPRREEVNHRLAKQDHRIKHDVKNGAMTKTQARALHRDDRQIRQEERDMAHQDGGHITKVDQRALNRQENGVRKQIHAEGGN